MKKVSFGYADIQIHVSLFPPGYSFDLQHLRDDQPNLHSAVENHHQEISSCSVLPNVEQVGV